MFINGLPFFWDSLANLYNMVGGAHFKAEHKAYTPKLQGDDALKYQVEQERSRAEAAEKELAAIKAERAVKVPQPKTASASKPESEPTLGKVMG
jgi:hypothetical protein